jgi:hypothetical protein
MKKNSFQNHAIISIQKPSDGDEFVPNPMEYYSVFKKTPTLTPTTSSKSVEEGEITSKVLWNECNIVFVLLYL